MIADELRALAEWLEAEGRTRQMEGGGDWVQEDYERRAATLRRLAERLEGRVVCPVEYRERTASPWVEARMSCRFVGFGLGKPAAIKALQDALDKEGEADGR